MPAFDPSSWNKGTIPQPADFQAIALDAYNKSANVDHGGYGISNAGWMILNPGELPGTQFIVTSAAWTAGVVTLTIGAHNIKAQQRVQVSLVSSSGAGGWGVGGFGVGAWGGGVPSGYNGSFVVASASPTTISYASPTNPGTFVSGGTVSVGGVTPALGMIAADAQMNVKIWNGSAFVAAFSSLWLNTGSGIVYSGGNVGIGPSPADAATASIHLVRNDGSYQIKVQNVGANPFTYGIAAAGNGNFVIDDLVHTLTRFAITPTGGILMPGLPNTNPGPGNHQLYYDPADGNRVKFAP